MHDDLLQQARHLAGLDSGRPKQANLRRAVSAAYYAIFHLLVDQSCRLAVGTQHAQRDYRQVLGRAFSHSAMKSACSSFSGGTLKSSVQQGLPDSFQIPTPVSLIASVFVALQSARHRADYDLAHQFSRKDVYWQIEQVESAIDKFQQLGSGEERKFFLACLWAWNGLVNR